jgi:hypothetical protein
MANDTSTITEADILAEVVGPASAGLSLEAARSLLDFKFGAATVRRIRRLLQKNNRGTITARERALLEKYLRVGQLLDLLHAKAKLCLGRTGDPA